MFSPKIITASLESWSRLLGPDGRPANFPPEYHTPTEAQQISAHFDAFIGTDPETGKMISSRDPDTSDWRTTLTPAEVKLIRNERILCRLDFRYFVSRYAYIKSEEDKIVRMVPWTSQEIFLDIVSEMQAEQIAIMLIILKARQLGLSRIISLILQHYVTFSAHINAFMASSTEQKTGMLYDMVDLVWSRLPFWMQPAKTAERAFKFVRYANDSAITLQHGQQTTGIARGTTPTKVHLSELAEFDDASSLVDSSLLRAMHDSPDTFLTLEGTAEGMNNWWHDKWNSSKSGWPERRSRLRPLFLPWFVGGLYPKSDWLRAHPVPDAYSSRMAPWAHAHSLMAREYVQKTDYLLKRLGSSWSMPIEQIWYYECERDAAIRERRLNRFLQEMPANDDEAFQSTNISVFDTETIVFYRDNAHLRPLEGVYGLRGNIEHLPARLQPSELLIDSSKPPIPIDIRRDGTPTMHFELVPLRYQGWSLEPKDGLERLYIWEHPVPGETYGFGVDTADGIGKDRTVIEGIRKYSVNGPTTQVVEYASDKMNAIDSWPFLLALGTYYSQPDSTGLIQQPRMAIECKGQGDLPQNIIRMMGWSNFHPWNDKQLDARKPQLSQYNKIGIYTGSGWFRDGMIALLLKLLKDGDIEVCSPHFVGEMQSLQGDEFVQSLKAGYGGHDDRIMALGFIIVSLYKWDQNYFRNARIAAYSGKSPLPSNVNSRPRQYAQWAYGVAERTDQGIYLLELP